jgi:GntR family transcriptional regulator
MPLDLDSRSVSRYDDRALHRQLADLIRTAIETGECKPGEPLPSETDIANTVSVSRTAVRDALDILTAEGLIVKRSGAVTRVATPPPVRHMATSRYADELRVLQAGGEHPLASAFTADHNIGWDAYTVEAEYTEGAATDADADRLDLTPGAAVLRRELVKYVAGSPAQIQVSVLPLELVSGTPVADPDRQPWPGGTIAELYSIGLVVTRVVEEAQARIPDITERRTLEMEAAGPVWDIVRIFYVGARPTEVSTVVCPARGHVLRYETDLSCTDSSS